MTASHTISKLLLLPSAKLVPLELQMEFGAIPAGMIPIASQPALRYITMPYVEQGYDVLIAVNEQAEQIDRYVLNHPELRAKTVDVGKTQSLGQTIANTLQSLETLPGQLVINFGDTYLGDALQGSNVICYQEQEDVFRWTTFQKDAQGKLSNILDKNQEKPLSAHLPVFVGVFSMDNPAKFLELLLEVLNDAITIPKDAQGLDPFYIALTAYFNPLSQKDKIFQAATDWRDFGHLDSYHTTKKLFSMNQRYFNQVQVDPRRGIVRKTSQDVQKFIHEINWYLRLPKSIKYMAPRVFDFSLEPSSPFVEMEFYGYPALNDMYLFGDCDMGLWNQVFVAIQNLILEMGQYHLKPEGPDTLKGAMQDIYYEKTLKRLQPILKDERFARFCNNTVTINQQECLGLAGVLESLPRLMETVNLYACDHFTVIHGDLCLSNILYDRRNRIIRLIDPRGTFGVFDIYGDPRYDLAKLSHSIEGDYDFLSNGLFDAYWEDDAFYFRPQLEKRHERIKEIFRARLLNPKRVEYWPVKLIESLLFLSMVPLHADRHRSQLAFLARGLEIYTAVLQQNLQSV